MNKKVLREFVVALILLSASLVTTIVNMCVFDCIDLGIINQILISIGFTFIFFYALYKGCE